eukprot:120067-Pyramimonas_sp.AAC.1
MRGPLNHLYHYLMEKHMRSVAERLDAPGRLFGLVNGKAEQIREECVGLVRAGEWEDLLDDVPFNKRR